MQDEPSVLGECLGDIATPNFADSVLGTFGELSYRSRARERVVGRVVMDIATAQSSTMFENR